MRAAALTRNSFTMVVVPKETGGASLPKNRVLMVFHGFPEFFIVFHGFYCFLSVISKTIPKILNSRIVLKMVLRMVLNSILRNVQWI